ncbi:hypothetical protein IMZ48_10485 [Candidatus Bathyarchaeota archaeon]|nr:hypothetical protein [Candidatus Bathyarchaeota archaeon]
MELEGPIIAEALRDVKIGGHTSQLVCKNFLGVCGYPDITEHEVALPEKPADSVRPAPSGKDPIKIVHYSDIHIDQKYVTGSSTNCTKPICCR